MCPHILEFCSIIRCCFFTALRCAIRMTSGRVRNKHRTSTSSNEILSRKATFSFIR
ncbi:hypothetical protein BC629DRAFT_1467523 [Irpex lacteus]|nr:hypothetical protein BC629DRAFT_1467523 [Irpex lacteus]